MVGPAAAVPVGGGGVWRGRDDAPNVSGRPVPLVRRVRRAWLRCPWVVAGPGRASRRRAERSSRRGRLAGGPPPTGTPSSPAHRAARAAPGTPVGQHNNTGIQAERPASRVARWTPPRPASWAAWVRHEKPSARYTASGCADRDGSRECDATATDRS